MKAFVDAFNAGDLDALAACVALDAWAEVVDAPFPREEGRAKIRATSFAYLLGESLTAELACFIHEPRAHRKRILRCGNAYSGTDASRGH